MAERKRRISLIVAAGVLVMASASTAVTAMAFLAVESAPLTLVVGWVNDHLSFAADGSPCGLVPLPIIFIALFAMVLAIRRGKRIFYLFIPLVSAMSYTLYTLSHMVVESARPYLASALLES